jgi:WD40-like Beta Propeller Repeat
MGEPFPGTPPSVRPPEDRLDSWKEIAAYLNRDVTTVQRWEKREGMPVHRHLHDRMGSVYAFRADLDTWARSRNLRAAEENGNDAPSLNLPAVPPRPAISTYLTKWKFVLPLAAAGVALAIGASLWFQRTEYFWRSPIANARFQTVTDFDGVEQDAAVSRDGQFVAFLSDRDGQMDVWVTQVGSGQFHNLTRGSAPELVNPSVRTLGFSPDGSFVTFWARKQNGSSGGGGRVRLVARRVPTRVPHARTRRPAVRVRRRPAIGGSAHFHRACRAPQSLSVVGTRHGIYLFRPGFSSGQTGYLAHPSNRRDS